MRRETIEPMARGLGLALLSLVLLVAYPAPLAAQVSLAELEAVVRDDSGQPLPGVTVQVVNKETGFRRQASTDAAGLATVAALPPGVYSASASLEGFGEVGVDSVALRVGQTARIEFLLRLQASDTITVTGEAPVVDLLRTDTSTNIVPEQIDKLPVANRDFEKLAFIAPGVERERGGFRFIGGAPVVGSGGNASQSSIFVDGVDFTDQALGLSRARFSQDAIREFRVINSRFDAEIGGSAGGALSIVTRSGTNDVKGSVFGFYRDDSLRSTGALEEGNLAFSRYQAGFTLGGPITQDRTHYFFSVEHIDEDNIALFRPGGAFTDQAEDVDHPFQQTLGLGSFDFQFSDASSGTLKLVYERYREDNFRVGGISDVSNGQSLNRDNWNAAFGHTLVLSNSRLNEARVQLGKRDYDEPTNSKAMEEWFSGGTTLKTGNNVVGDLVGEGDYAAFRDTFYWQAGRRSTHDLKAGASLTHVKERSVIDVFQEGLLVWAFDTRTLPSVFIFGEGSSDVTISTNLWGAFIQDDWSPRPDLTVSFGARYDLDTNGNDPNFQHPLVGSRGKDDDNYQLRTGFSWDMTEDGNNILRGGVGMFTGRFLLVPDFTELQQNGVTGRVVRSNLNGALLGLPPAFWLDPANPYTTGIPLPPDISLLEDNLQAPESTQASLGYTRRLGETGLFFDIEAVYADGDNEIVIRDLNFGGNSNPVRLNPVYNQINTYTNDGHSKYKALILGLNGRIFDKHLLTASLTLGDKKNISDDFSPVFPTGYPSDPADIEGEYGPSRGQEDYRLVVSGIFQLPWNLTLAPIYEYGSGQPWNHILGVDYNGDGKNSDRPAGVGRNSEDGPPFRQLSLRLTKTVLLGGGRSLELIVEGFNVLDNTNFDVTSVDNAEFLSAPTLANPFLPVIPNPNFGEYRATLPPREIQLGVRYRF